MDRQTVDFLLSMSIRTLRIILLALHDEWLNDVMQYVGNAAFYLEVESILKYKLQEDNHV
jgi:hypothetical protein